MVRHYQRYVARDTLCRLVHDFCLLGADGKTKVVARSREVIHTLLHFRFSVAVKSTVIPKEELYQSSEVEHSSICSVLQLDAIVIIS